MWHISKGNENSMLPTSNENMYHDREEMRCWYLGKLIVGRP
jgi:hypothetical protein